MQRVGCHRRDPGRSCVSLAQALRAGVPARPPARPPSWMPSHFTSQISPSQFTRESCSDVSSSGSRYTCVKCSVRRNRRRPRPRTSWKRMTPTPSMSSSWFALIEYIGGVDVVLFAILAYDYGDSCPAPNVRWMCVSYSDSVSQFMVLLYSGMASFAV